jgi:hypothetical protein
MATTAAIEVYRDWRRPDAIVDQTHLRATTRVFQVPVASLASVLPAKGDTHSKNTGEVVERVTTHPLADGFAVDVEVLYTQYDTRTVGP